MTTTPVKNPPQETPVQSPQRASYPRQIQTLVRRNLIHIKRQPEMLSDVTIQPIMFVLLFAFVFGGSIQTGSAAGYREWLLPGIMAQTMTFAAFVVAIGLTNDLQKGIIDRFRSLPMSSSAVLVSRSVSSLIHSSIGVVVMAVTGLLIGWRIRTDVGRAALAFALLLLFGFAMIWIGILVGSAIRTLEGVNGVMFTTIFPITFLANTFAPTENMPRVLQVIAEWNPISALVQSLRELWGNLGGTATPSTAAWPLQHSIWVSIGWSVLISLVIAPLALRAYRRRTTD
ncbi:ABC transporter permease [Cumulibacter soli]|uniref:ABC transporter permease n=1 Tax=Cumulibacter soli TaxID=2546344 RepID=UPI001068A238|nr:ABC transporter permease [Cumulibacter soli]